MKDVRSVPVCDKSIFVCTIVFIVRGNAETVLFAVCHKFALIGTV